MKKETDELLAEVLADETRLRETTLRLGLAEMRRVRQRRRTMCMTVAICLPVLALAAIYLRELSNISNSTHGALPRVTQIKKTIPGTPIRVLNDEELLEFFKDRPVALIGAADHQRLILFDEVTN